MAESIENKVTTINNGVLLGFVRTLIVAGVFLGGWLTRNEFRMSALENSSKNQELMIIELTKNKHENDLRLQSIEASIKLLCESLQDMKEDQKVILNNLNLFNNKKNGDPE